MPSDAKERIARSPCSIRTMPSWYVTPGPRFGAIPKFISLSERSLSLTAWPLITGALLSQKSVLTEELEFEGEPLSAVLDFRHAPSKTTMSTIKIRHLMRYTRRAPGTYLANCCDRRVILRMVAPLSGLQCIGDFLCQWCHRFGTTRARDVKNADQLFAFADHDQAVRRNERLVTDSGKACGLAYHSQPLCVQAHLFFSVVFVNGEIEDRDLPCVRRSVFLLTLEDFERSSGKLLQHLLCLFVGATGRRHGRCVFSHHVGLSAFGDVGAAVVFAFCTDDLDADRLTDIFF